MNDNLTSSNHPSAFERFIEKYPKLSTTLAFLLILFAAALAARVAPEEVQLTSQQEAELEAWEQGYQQGQQAHLNLCGKPAVNLRSGDG